ncbi:pyridoxamine 5'-phosphate oxidase [Paraburkholderia sp. Ac-20336]|uniref:HugZ family pyridoxamine 5'-phosphate oxidase n=1 Tax=Burkholderiaceae TaxID=119060 RepID=UPI001423F645|nr:MULTISPECIES: pyridoxamine 5'-phosphate oxidase family protein [Burkholderiaceae]MBN3804126.1 pyridoxamine 5'-phosphate oxidase [Paraburkholderia sp. Ac-20336]MBN3847074.1 pyridoxamine 5'-phosphate oxidase [Paraburkholderia sp. Ac-20342]NIF53190.1 pyridoxamine 5'-phosphate oxidase [Burkholderia sp. Ax-1724]NIF76755.1 pyridoxamine 5'-phosphate oxidase [Paraburkholderia sp. Cy-641]
MNIPAHAPLHLLHTAAVGTLATHARGPGGFPYPSVLPFAPDARHRPTILISRLAEHTHNLLADPRAGFLAVDAPDGDVLGGQRATLLGTFEPAPEFVRRYLRYHPEAERYLMLGDFSFWTMQIERLRYIGGFGAMGWLDGAELDALPPLGADEENALLDEFGRRLSGTEGVEFLGIDRYGVDLKQAGMRRRCTFDGARLDAETLHAALEVCIERYAH